MTARACISVNVCIVKVPIATTPLSPYRAHRFPYAV